MKEYFEKLLHYTHWANERILHTLYEKKIDDQEIIKLMSHIINAQFIWFSRVSSIKEHERKVWDSYELHMLASVSKESSRLWIMYLKDIPEEKLNAYVSYVNSQGKEFTNPVSEIITHVINHGTYHRAQIAKLLRQKNVDPPNTDYIIYLRENN